MRQFSSLFKQFAFWMLVFASQRLVFLLYYKYLIKASEIEVGEVFRTFFYALKLDISTASYVLIIPSFIYIIQLIIKGKWAEYVNFYFTMLILVAYLLISAAELGLYAEWQTKVTYKALLYLRQPEEIINSVSTGIFAGLILLLAIQFALFYFLYKKLVFNVSRKNESAGIIGKLAFVILMPLLLLFGIRGGLQAIPISISQSYFSKHDLLNQAAVNTGYNLVFSVMDNIVFEKKNVFNTLPQGEASLIVHNLHKVEKDTTVIIVNTDRPNVVIILLESWSGDLIESLGGEPGITPGFHKLENEGLLFTRFYTTGNRSQQAIASIYAGFPAIPVVTLTDFPEKYRKVPSLVKKLNKSGYFTSFYFGGQLIYGNIRSFLLSNEFGKLIEGEDFKSEIPRGKLGVHDEYLFERFLNDLGNMPQPFFATAFTLSSHSPYDQPGERPIDWIELENEFVNSAHYTDQCLYEFMKNARQQEWYENTLFIIMADHSHSSYKGFPLGSFKYHQIPLLFTGGALKEEFRGIKSDFLSSNVDITTSLLKQLGIASNEFFWSKNIFNPNTPEFAYFELNEGFGWKRPFGEVVVNLRDGLAPVSNEPEEIKNQLDKEGRAYIQVMVDEFLSY